MIITLHKIEWLTTGCAYQMERAKRWREEESGGEGRGGEDRGSPSGGQVKLSVREI